MKSPPTRGEVARVLTHPNLREWQPNSPVWSLPPTTPVVEKATPLESRFYRLPDGSSGAVGRSRPSNQSNPASAGTSAVSADLDSGIGSEGRATAPSAPGRREPAGEPARPAAQRSEQPGTRAERHEARAPARPAVRGACPSQRKGDRQSDQRERNERRLL